MANYGVVVLNKVAASDVNTYVRAAKCASQDIENGMVMQLATGRSTVADEGEVWLGTVAAGGAGLTHLWMAFEPEISRFATGASTLLNTNPDPRTHYNPQGKVFTAFKPQIGDIITLTGDVITTGTGAGSAYAVATASDFQLVWASAAVSGLSLKLLETTFLSIPDGGINTGRYTAYKFEVVAIA